MKMTISTPPTNERQQNINTTADNKSVSPCSSPKSSPRSSPKAQTKRDHSKSETLLTVSYNNKEQQTTAAVQSPPQVLKHEGSPSSQEGSISGRVSSLSNTTADYTPPQQQQQPQNLLVELRHESSGSTRDSSKDKRDSSGRSKKKSSWFNSFYPTYKSRSEDFKRLFKDVPDEERLVVDYSCALQKEILVQGRLYVTQNYLCFYANIFGWETNQTLKWKEVAAITKEKTALVIPNAVAICTKAEKFFFTSFVSRDKTYLMLFRFWQNALMDQPMSAQELWQWVHQCYGNELGLTSDDEDYIAPNLPEEEKLSARLSVESFSENESVLESLVHSFIMDEKLDDDAKLAVPSSEKLRYIGSDSQLPTDITDNSDSDGDKPISMKIKIPVPRIPRQHSSPSFLSHNKQPPPHTPDSDDSSALPLVAEKRSKCDASSLKCTSLHEGRNLLNEVLPIHIDQLFTLLFTSSKFYLDFHASRKTTDLTQTPWTHNPLDNTKSRVVNLTVQLAATIGPKTAQVTETQMMLPCSKAGALYAIDVESMNAGIPYADSFCVNFHYCLQKVSDTRSSIMVFAQLIYKKSVWGLVKGMIERNCWSGLEDFYTKLKEALQAECEGNIPELKKKSRRTRRLHSMPRIENSRLSIPRRKLLHNSGIFNSDVCTIIVFTVLLLLLILNVMLYYKLWSLEDAPPYSLLDLHVLKNPPKSHDEWIKLLRQQESLHTVEAQKWQTILKTSVDLLRQAEESLSELQRSIHPSYVSKIMSIISTDKSNPTPSTETEQEL